MGNISVNFGASGAYTIKLEWTQGTQNKAANTTAVHFACRLHSNRSGATFMGQAKTDKLTVGTKTGSPQHGSYVVPGGGSVLLWEYDMVLTHDSDGSFSKAVSVNVQIDTTFSSSGYVGTVTASGTMELDTIPRASSMAISGNTLGSPVSFTITSAASEFLHSLTYKYGSAESTIISYEKAGTYKWTPELSLASNFPDSPSGDVIYTLYTWTADKTLIATESFTSTLSIPVSAAPTVESGWAAAAHYNTGTAAENIAAFVQGYSKAQINFDASKITLQYGATIKSYKIVCGTVSDTEAPYLTGVLNSTSAKITCTVYDSRGHSASETLTIAVLPYKKPTLSDLSLYRSDEDGVASPSGACIWAKATLIYSDLGGKNSCTLMGYYRLASGSYSANGTSMDSGVGIALTNAAAAIVSYVAKIVAKDSLGNQAEYEVTIPTETVTLHLRERGLGGAFGKYAEEDDLLDVAWRLRVRKELMLDVPLSMANGGTGVVEEGESGNWYYRKYENGIAECWGQENFTGDTNFQWGSLYALVCYMSNYPVVFTKPPVTARDVCQNTNKSCWVSSWNIGNAANAGQFALMRPDIATLDVTVHCYAIGTWK